MKYTTSGSRFHGVTKETFYICELILPPKNQSYCLDFKYYTSVLPVTV